MSRPALTQPPGTHRYTSEEYFDLVARGLLDPDDRVELLEGVIVAMSPQSPRHAGSVHRVGEALRRVLGGRAAVREDKPLVASSLSVPEPDIAVVECADDHYTSAHPKTAFLIVEVADSSLPQDRLTKSRIYAAAGIADYWVVDSRHDVVHVFRDPDPANVRYHLERIVVAGDRLVLVAFPDVTVDAAELLPPACPS